MENNQPNSPRIDKVKDMQCKHIKALCRLSMRAKMGKYPNMPERFIPAPKYSDKTANGLTKCVIDFIRLQGGQAERVANMGRLVDDRSKSVLGQSIGGQKWIKGTGKNGSADIHATIRGRSVKIEVKCAATGDNNQSPLQIAYQKEVEQAGGVYVIARTFKGFYTWYEEFQKELEK